MSFSLDDIPALTDKHIIITGASSGIGLSCARMLASKGAHVVMACRNLSKAAPLAAAISASARSTGGRATALPLDTTDLDSIDSFARLLPLPRVDALVLNAGIMATKRSTAPTRSLAHPEMDRQMSANAVGHFYLVHLLSDLLRASPGARIVPVSSVAAARTRAVGSVSYAVLTGGAPAQYSPTAAYAESKLAALLVGRELARRLARAGVDVDVVPAHPGIARTRLAARADSLRVQCARPLLRVLGMSADGGGTVLAVAAAIPRDRLPRRPYVVPKGAWQVRGRPTARGKMPAQAKDKEQAANLWAVFEELCDVKTEF